MSKSFDVAWKFLTLGRPVIPSGGGRKGKSALVEWGEYQQRLPTEAELFEWESSLKPHVWGMITGGVSGLFVIDADTKAAVKLMEGVGLQPHVRTPKGGHYYFHHPPFLVSNSTKRVPGFDVRGEGGYANFCGSNGKVHYEVLMYPTEDNLYTLDQLPPELEELIKPKPAKADFPRESPGKRHYEQNDKFNEIAVTKAIEHCAFLQHCERDAATLPRNDWWSLVQLLTPFGDPGQKQIHELSKAYPNYTEEETTEYIKNAQSALDKGIGPHTCVYIADELGFACSPDCQARAMGAASPAGMAMKLIKQEKWEEAYHLTDMGNASRLIAQWGDILRYVPGWKKWLIWNGKSWAPDEKLEIINLAKRTVRGMLVEAAKIEDEKSRKKLAKFALQSESEQRLMAMVSLARSEAVIMPDELNRDRWLLNVQNGTVDLHTGKLREHRKDDFITRKIPVDYDEYAQCPKWLAFLGKVLEAGGGGEDYTSESKDLAGFLQRAVGYSLTGDVGEHCLFFLHGSGQNGKSTFLDTLGSLLHDYSCYAPFSSFLLTRNPDPVRNDLARLAGKRMVLAVEAAVGSKMNEAVVKSITGGDKITCRFLHQEFFDYLPEFKLWLAANYKLSIYGTDLGIWSRIRLIPFKTVITDEERNIHLKEELKGEFPGILAWAVHGCLEYLDKGLRTPAVVEEATCFYREEEDPLDAWLEERCVVKEGLSTKSSALYNNYVEWCETNHRKPIFWTVFGKLLGGKGIDAAKRHGLIYRRGLSLSADPEAQIEF